MAEERSLAEAAVEVKALVEVLGGGGDGGAVAGEAGGLGSVVAGQAGGRSGSEQGSCNHY